MKKLLSIVFISALFFSCSTDNNEVIDNPEQTAQTDLETLVAQGNFDESPYGIYEGVFTSLEDNSRSTVRLEFDGKMKPLAVFNFPSGELKSFRSKSSFKASSNLSKSQMGSETLHFSGENFDFDFTVNEDGSNPVVSNVTYMGAKGDIMVMKETSKAAITPRTGTYSCVPNGGCENHPDLGTGKTQTFNAILQTTTSSGNVADNSQSDIVFQVVLGGWTYYMASSTPSMQQHSCTDSSRTIGGVVFDVTRCQFSGDIQGGSGLATINGTHRYGRQVTFSGTSNQWDCSDYFGTMVYESSLFGTIGMEFVSDDVDGVDSYCFPNN